MSVFDEINNKFDKHYNGNETEEVIRDYREGNPMEGMFESETEDSQAYKEQIKRAKWIADHPGKVGFHKRFINCWISFTFVIILICCFLNSPKFLSGIGLFFFAPLFSGVFNLRGHIIDRSLYVATSVIAGVVTVAGATCPITPWDWLSGYKEMWIETLEYILKNFFQIFMFALLLTAVGLIAVKLLYPMIKRIYCNVPVDAIIVGYDKIRFYGSERYSPLYQYVYQGKKYLKISPGYVLKEEGMLGACGEVLINADQPKDAILPEKNSKFEYFASAVLAGLFMIMFVIYIIGMF